MKLRIQEKTSKLVRILVVILFTITYSYSQNNISIEDQYNNLMNYVPIKFNDAIEKPTNPKLNIELKTIGTLSLVYQFKNQYIIDEKDKKWLKGRVVELANALFNEKKIILLSLVNGLIENSKNSIVKKNIEGNKILELKFIYSCTENTQNIREFINIFNNEMYQLMEIKTPNNKTLELKGKYKGIKKRIQNIELLLTEYGLFKFWKHNGHSSDFTQGKWELENDVLTLNSKPLSKNDSLTYLLSSAKWIEFKNIKLKIENKRIKGKKWNLKKVEN